MRKNNRDDASDVDTKVAEEVARIIACSYEVDEDGRYELDEEGERIPKTTSQVVTISPKAADLILDKHNDKNRNLSEHRAREMSKLMCKGKWKDCVSSISFGIDGMLLDGQHRLRACVLSERPLTITVVNGVPNEHITEFDIGRSRTGGDTLAMHDVKNAALIGAAIRKILVFDRCYGEQVTRATWSHPVSNQDILDWYNKHPEVHDAVKITKNSNAGYRWATTTTLVAMYWLFGHGEEAKRFVSDLISGEGLVAGDPVLALRNLLTNREQDKRHEEAGVLALYIHAWNARQEGKRLKFYDSRALAKRRAPPADAIQLPGLKDEFPRPLPPAEKPHVYRSKAK